MKILYGVLCALSMAMACEASAVAVGKLEYELDEASGTAIVVGPASSVTSLKNLTIPSKVTVESKSYTVTAVGDYAFKGCSSFTGTLSIANTVTSIGDYAFYSCSGFTSELSIPNSVVTIGEAAFMYCSRLKGSLTIPNSVSTIGPSAFYDCGGFKGSLTIGNGVVSIGKSAFTYCSGFSGALSIPNSVSTIEPYAFSGCSGFKESLTIGNSVLSIGEYAFEGCTFTGALTLPAGLKSIGAWAFNGCTGFTGPLSIPASVTEIGKGAFSGCRFTGELILPESLTAVSAWVFNGCSGFTGTLTVGNNVTEIGDYAFAGCTGFETLTLGSALESICNKAFSNTGFLEITSKAATPPAIIKGESYGHTAFDPSSYNNPLYVPAESLEAYRRAYEWKEFKLIQQIGFVDTESISLSDSELTLLIGEKARLVATVLPEDATYKTVNWTSGDRDVATVDSDGNITTKGTGETIITATCGELSASCVVTVLPILVRELIINPSSWTGTEGSSFTIMASVLPENATMPSVEFISTDLSVATVDYYGHVEVLSEGMCSIIVSTVDGSDLTAECEIMSTSGICDAAGAPQAGIDVIDLNGTVLVRGCTRRELGQLSPGIYIIRSGSDAPAFIVVQ